MTYSFIKAVESEPGTTYGRLLTAMRATIRDNGGDLGIPGPIGTFFRRVITFSCAQVLQFSLKEINVRHADPVHACNLLLLQEPQLCSSEPFDIYRKPFVL
jgi:metacaspase-1